MWRRPKRRGPSSPGRFPAVRPHTRPSPPAVRPHPRRSAPERGARVEYNLTQRERQILVRLLELSQHSKEQFEARVNASPEAPAKEVARLHFAGGVQTMEVTKRDLRVLKDEGLIHFRWHAPDRGAGRLASLAFEAVGTNFQGTASSDAAALSAAAATASALVVADEKAIALRFKKITAEL